MANGLGIVDELVMFKIFSHMTYQEHVRCMLVCRQWRNWLYTLTEGCLICQVTPSTCSVHFLLSIEEFLGGASSPFLSMPEVWHGCNCFLRFHYKAILQNLLSLALCDMTWGANFVGVDL